jgi:hypothetical protein
MRRACSMHEIRNAYKILVGKPEGKRPLGRHSGHSPMACSYKYCNESSIPIFKVGNFLTT